MALQAIGLIGVAIWSGLDGASARAWSFAATLIVLATCVAVLAALLVRGRAVARTPTMLWNALLLPAGFTVGDGGAPGVGWLIIGLAVATFVATLSARPKSSATSQE